MIVFDAPVAPDASTAFVREVPVPSELKLLAMFPPVTVTDNEVDFGEITRTNRTARYRSFDGRIHVADRDGAGNKRIKMAPFSDSLNMGEYERLQLEFARTGGTRTEALANAIYDDAALLTRYMQNRMELAIGDVLTDGIFNPGLASEFGGVADFGVAAGNKPTAAVLWTYSDALVLDDLIAWCDAYEAANGVRPGGVLTSRRVMRAVNKNPQLINAAKGAQTGVSRISLADAYGVFDDEGIPTNWQTYETQLDVDGVATRAIPDDRFILLPPDPQDMLEFRMGLSATALELVNSSQSDMSFEEAPGIVGVVEKVGPPYRQFTFVDAVGLPVLKDARKLFVADVA